MSSVTPPTPRQALRASLLAQREQFMAGPGAAEAGAALTRHLVEVLLDLEPESLGLYWPHRSEFNAAAGVLADEKLAKLPLCLPQARKAPVRMDYRAWDGRPPTARDECGIPCSEGAPARPDVVLVPCVGFTGDGHRLGYGGGYFDRWLDAHPEATAVGIAWSGARIDTAQLEPQPHDRALTLIVTDAGVV